MFWDTLMSPVFAFADFVIDCCLQAKMRFAFFHEGSTSFFEIF